MGGCRVGEVDAGLTLREKGTGESGRLDLKEKHLPERNLLGNCFFCFFQFSSSSCILEALYCSQAGRKSSQEDKRYLFLSKINCPCAAFNDTNSIDQMIK